MNVEIDVIRADLYGDYAALENTFKYVVEAYLEIKELPMIGAAQIDRDQPKQRLLNAQGINYRVDVEHAVESVLNTKVEQDGFFALLADEPVDPLLHTSIIKKCAKVFQKRGLSPLKYFSPKRRGSAESVRRAA
jgi:hypothetical protein